MEFKKIERKFLREIRTLSKPQDIVKEVITCTVLLMGHPASDAKDWNKVKMIIHSSMFLEDLEKCNPKECNPENVSIANEKLKSMNREDVLKTSEAATEFYDRNMEMLAAAASC